MGRHGKLPHGFLHTFFSSGPHLPCDTFVLCLNWVLPGIPFSLFLSQPFFLFFSFSPQIDASGGRRRKRRSGEREVSGGPGERNTCGRGQGGGSFGDQIRCCTTEVKVHAGK